MQLVDWPKFESIYRTVTATRIDGAAAGPGALQCFAAAKFLNLKSATASAWEHLGRGWLGALTTAPSHRPETGRRAAAGAVEHAAASPTPGATACPARTAGGWTRTAGPGTARSATGK